MAYCVLGAQPLLEPIINYVNLDISMKYESKYIVLIPKDMN